MSRATTVILGGGVTGLATGYISGCPVYEAAADPGGICCSYYIRPGDTERLAQPPPDHEAYRFEIGGGHWIFGADDTALGLISELTGVTRYQRVSSVFFPDTGLFVPYPLQNNLRYLPEDVATRALSEIGASTPTFRTMREWLSGTFGETLFDMFYGPFHDLYTAGLYADISPQDSYKTPLNLELIKLGARRSAGSVGYNASYCYPRTGLDALARRMAARCDFRSGKRAREVDTGTKQVLFEDGSRCSYDKLYSTLPLNQMLEISGVFLAEPAAPHTSVLVLNIGAQRGEKTPPDHWLYLPQSQSGFHRVGFYSNVDRSFLPRSSDPLNAVGIYVERAYVGGVKPDVEQIENYQRQVVAELQRWGFIGDTEVVDATWIDVAYTWSYPGSGWAEEAVAALRERGIVSLGRYGRWTFQGITDSIAEGLEAGKALGNG